jgi:hypothetical protein
MLDIGNHSQVKLVFYMAKELEHQTTPQVMRVQALPMNRRVRLFARVVTTHFVYLHPPE